MSVKTHLTSNNSNKRFIKASASTGLTASQQSAVDLVANLVQYQYLMVGGGGASQTTDSVTGGGGAGMFTQGNVLLQKNVSTNIIIGAGAVSYGPSTPGAIANRGNDSWLRQNDLVIIAIGGGRSGIPSALETSHRGAPFAYIGYPGGSGGGGTSAPSSPPFAGGGGIAGGYPGGTAQGYVPNGGGGGGGGATQAGYPAQGNPASLNAKGGDGANVSWVPTNYGTPGWGPGRWFAGGGGGSYNDGSPFGTMTTPMKRQGGSGGGGVGGILGPGYLGYADSGNVNTGGGSGGHFGPGPIAYTVTGGSGVVIFSVPLTATWTNAIGANVETTATSNIIGFRTSGQITFT